MAELPELWEGPQEGDGVGAGCGRQQGGRSVASSGKYHLRS